VRLGLLLAAVAALLVAAATGWYPYAKLSPAAADATVRPGESVQLAGVRYRLDAFTVAASLPAEQRGDPAVAGPAGSVLVLVVLRETVLDHTVRLDELTCDVTLTDDAGTVWSTDSDFTSQLARPAAYGCADTPTNPLRYDVERATGFSFVVPADRAGHLAARLELGGKGPTLVLRP
jgi:hypothetical protein